MLQDRYELEDVLGQGGMGWVQRGRDTRTGRAVAIKFLEQRSGTDDLAMAFSWEVRAVARLDHPGVVDLYNFGWTEDDTPYIVMALSGGTALNRIPRRYVDWPCLGGLIYQVLQILAHAHARGVFHHDLKPSNIMVHRDLHGRLNVQLIDFGIAAVINRQVATQGEGPSRLVGTASYMAPEAIRSFALYRFSPAADIYALGVIAYELAYGSRPFAADDTRELLMQHQELEPPDLPLRRDLDAPPEFGAFVRRMLAKSPRERFGTAPEALAALAEIVPSEVRSGRVPVVPQFPTSRFPELDSGGYRAARTREILGDHLKLLNIRQPAFAGREEDQAFLWGRLGDAVASEKPTVVLLTGDSGVGISRLILETGQRAAEGGRARVAVVPYSRSSTDSVEGWRAALLALLGYTGAGRDQVALSIGEDLRWLGLDATLQREAALDLLFPPTRAVAGESGERGPAFDWVGTYLRILVALAQRCPILIGLEDFQAMDEDLGIELMQFLLRVEESCTILVLMSLRTGRPGDGDTAAAMQEFERLQRYTGFLRRRVLPLSRAGMTELLSGIVPLRPELRERIVNQAGGFPLYVVELLRLWERLDLIRHASDGYYLTRDDAPLPETLHDLWQERVNAALADGAADDALDILSRAAVLGHAFTYDTLREVVLCSEDPELIEALNHAWNHWHEEGLWHPVEPGRSVFVHHSVRQAIISRIDEDERRLLQLHCAQARLMAPMSTGSQEVWALATHFEQAGVPEEAFPFYIRAGRQAFQAGRYRASFQCCRRAAQQLSTDTDAGYDRRWGVTYQLLTNNLVRLGRLPEAESVALRLLEAGDEWNEPLQVATAQRLIAEIKIRQGVLQRAEELLVSARDTFQRLAVHRELARVLVHLGEVWRDRRPPREAQACFRQARESFARVQDVHGTASAFVGEARLLLATGNLLGADRMLDGALRIFQDLADRAGVADAVCLRGQTALARRDAARAFRSFEEASGVYRSVGNRNGVAICLLCSGRVYRAIGQPEKALDCFEQARSSLEVLDNEQGVAWAQLELAQLQLDRGEIIEGTSRIERLMVALGQLGGARDVTLGIAIRARCNAERDMWPEADNDLCSAVERANAMRIAEIDFAEQLERIADRAVRAEQIVIAETALLGAAAVWRRLGRADQAQRLAELRDNLN